MEVLTEILKSLWMGGLAATPLILLVGLICRLRSLRPATRHVLWCAVLVSLIAPAIGTSIWRPDWFRSDRLVDAQSPVPGPAYQSESAAQGSIALGRGGGGGADRNGGSGDPALDWKPSMPLLARRTPNFSPNETGPAELKLNVPSQVAAGGSAAAPSWGSSSSSVAMEMPTSTRLVDSPEKWSAAQPPNPEVKPEMALKPLVQWPGTREPVLLLARNLVARLLAVRDSIAAMPPIPAGIWLCGSAIVVALSLFRTISASRMLRGARPASPEIRALVQRTAERVGLRRVPQTLVVDRAVSPLIWCGWKPRLVLPLELWSALDDESRRAVLIHELAHLRRFDHVFCWIELFIGALYWWHPLAWWARIRLRDEAEASCDAWVTSTLPSSRRAYATALVATKSFVSPEGWSSKPSLGIMSGSATKLARRITMVMTQRTAPKLSLLGACVAASVVALGMFVMPGLACPPQDAPEAGSKAPGSDVVILRSRSPKAKKAVRTEILGEMPAPEATRAGSSNVSADALPGTPVALSPSDAASYSASPEPSAAPKSESDESGQSGVKHSAPRAKGISESASDPRVGKVARVYRLPSGKLDSLWELLSRNDVPVFVERRGGDSLVIFAREDQHPSIAAFVQIINPAGDNASAARAGGPKASVASAKAYRESLRRLEQSRAALERDAERARENADRLQEQHEKLMEMSEQLRNSAGELEEASAREAVEKAASELDARAEQARARTDAADQQAGELERRLGELEQRVGLLEEQLSALDEAEAEMDESGEFVITEEPDEMQVIEGAPEMNEMPEPESGSPASAIPADPADPAPELEEAPAPAATPASLPSPAAAPKITPATPARNA